MKNSLPHFRKLSMPLTPPTASAVEPSYLGDILTNAMINTMDFRFYYRKAAVTMVLNIDTIKKICVIPKVCGSHIC